MDVDALGVCLLSICLVIVTVVWVKGICGLRNASNTNRWLKILFHVGVCSAEIYISANILVLCLWDYKLGQNTYYETYELLYLTIRVVFFPELQFCILSTLIVRLWITFNDSAWRMSKCTKITFVIIIYCDVLRCSHMAGLLSERGISLGP